jgi:hypothetical protein
MKNSRLFLLPVLAIGIGLLAARWSSAQTKTQASGKQADTGLALHRLDLLVAHLEAKKDTKAIELLTDYQHALDGQQASAAIATNIRLILQKLREGRTQEVIEWQEGRLASDAVTLYASYNQITAATRDKLSLRSLGYVRDYFTKYPARTRPLFRRKGLPKHSNCWIKSLETKNER